MSLLKMYIREELGKKTPFFLSSLSLYNAEHHARCSSMPKTCVSEISVLLKSKARLMLVGEFEQSSPR